MKKYFAIIFACVMIVFSVCACSNKEELKPIDLEGETQEAPQTVAAPENINLDAIMETVAEAESETEPETTAAETKAETKPEKKETKPAKKEEKKETKAETDAESPAETTAEKPGEEGIAAAETDANGYVTAVDESASETLTPGQNGGPTGSDTSAPAGGTSPSGSSDVIYVEKGPGE